MLGLVAIDGNVYRWLGNCADATVCPSALEQTSVEVFPTRTVATFDLPSPLNGVATVTFLSTMFTDDYPRLSRPVTYVSFEVDILNDVAVDASSHTVVITDSFCLC